MEPDAYRCSTAFRQLLLGFDVAEIEAQSDIVYGLTANLELAYFNPAWFRFSENNGGEPAISAQWALGRLVIDAIPNELKDFYRNLFVAALTQAPPSPSPSHHEYVCPSPTLHRLFTMTIYPLRDAQGLLVANSLQAEYPIGTSSATLTSFDESLYQGIDGIITQCCHCRKVKNQSEPARWDWLPRWVEQSPPKTSHGLCNLCFAHYYPEED